MASGTINLNKSDLTTKGSYIIGKIQWSSAATNADNDSDVTAKIYVKKGNDSTTLTTKTSGTWRWSLDIGGTVVSGSVSAGVLLDWVEVGSAKVSDIAHNSNGTKSITIKGTVTPPSTSNFGGLKTTGSGTAVLDSIPRASVITAATAVILGNACSVKWTPASASFRYKLKFVLGDWSYTTAAIHPNKTSAYTYTGYKLPLEAAKQIPDSKTGTMTVTLYTYSDSAATVQIGSADSETFTVTVPDNSSTMPAVTMSLSPVSSLKDAFAGLYIQGKTRVKAELSASGKYGATIKSYSVKVGGASYGSDNGYTSAYLAKYGTVEVVGYAIDSRDITGAVSKNITVIAYGVPKIQSVVAARCDSDGSLSDSGTYLKITAKRSYSPVKSGDVQKNFCQIRYRYKAAEASAYSDWVTILAGDALDSDTVETGALLGGVLAVDTAYVVQVGVIDDIGETAQTTVPIPTDKIYWHRDGARRSLGFGEYVQEDNTFSIAGDITFKAKGPALLSGGVNGIYGAVATVSGTNIITIQTKFDSFGDATNHRQTFFLFGSDNGTMIHGLLRVNSAGGTLWSGEGTITASALDGGIVEITLPTTAWDTFVVLSAGPFTIL